MAKENNRPQQNPTAHLEDNLKKATTELLILHLLAQREFYINELTETLCDKSAGALKIIFPYSAIYRLTEAGYIIESGKRSGPDGRRRQYLAITEAGREYYAKLRSTYCRFVAGVDTILSWQE